MNLPSFIGSSTNKDLGNFNDKLNKVFEVMFVVDIESVDLSSYQLKVISNTWFDKWK